MSAFIIKVKTDNAGTSNTDQFTLPGNSSYSYNFDVDWGDGSPVETINSGSSWTHTFAGGVGTYSVEITENVAGGFPTIQFANGGDRLKLLEIEQWGTNRWDTFNLSFFGCSNLTITATDEATADTGGVTDFFRAWQNCSSLTSFPVLNTSSGTNFSAAWASCSSLTSFPVLDTSSGTNFESAWGGCSSLTSFPLLDTSNGTNFGAAWGYCSSLTSFPLLDTSNGTNFGSAYTGTWQNCSSLTSFPLIDTSNGTNFRQAWRGCSSLTSFPLINTSNGTNFGAAWYYCSSLTSFPLLDTSNGTSFQSAWANCSYLTSFPLIDTSNATTLQAAWESCTSLTSFPLINTSNVTRFEQAWVNCSSLTSFPLIDTSSGTIFQSAWNNCSSLTSFPLIDTSSGTNFNNAWYNCSSLTSFPLIDTSSGTSFSSAWRNCSSLTSFPTLDFRSMSNGANTFLSVTLNTASYDAILEKSFLNNTNNGVTFHGGNSTYFKRGKKQRDILTAEPRNWTITDGGYDATHVYPDWKDGLQGWWVPSLDEDGNGTTTLTDLSGNGNNGTLTNMDAATDWVADTGAGGVRALDLDGSSEYINIPDGSYKFAADDSGTISMWVKYDSLVGLPVIYSKGGSTSREFAAYNSGTQLLSSASNFKHYVISGTLLTGVWYHFVYTLDDSGVQRLYVDGVLVDTNLTVASFIPRNAPLQIGASSGQSLYLTGRWDAFALYHRALTADEVTQLYNGGRSLNLLAGGPAYSPLSNGRLLNPLNRGRIR